MRAFALGVGAWLLTGTATAQTPPAATPPAASAVVAGDVLVVEDADAAKVAKREVRRLQSIQRRRLACGCAMPRLLRYKEKEVTFDAEHGMTAWVRNDGSALLESFRLEEDGSLTPVPSPLKQEPFVVPSNGGDVLRSAYELVRTHAVEPGDPFYLGVLVPPRRRPGDVVKVTPVGGGAPPRGAAARLDELWVGPLDQRDSDRCGAFDSHRLLTTPREGTPAPAGYIVTYTPQGERPRTTLIDERHARIFGIGRVGPCEHGMPFDVDEQGEVPAQLELRTVSATFAVGPPWRWRLSQIAGELPTPLATPEGTSLDTSDSPFLIPARDPVEGIMSDEKDRLAFGIMAFVVLGAAALARMLYAARRRRGRYTEVLACPSCESEMTVDLEDPETDGMFCPKCGKSSVFVSFEADGAPKAHVVKLSENSAKPV